MKRILILITPVILIMLAFRPINSHTITGTITDEKGSPVPSAIITMKGTTQGALSDSKGVYHITVSKSSGTLIFSSAGYISVQENISGRSVIDVTLKAASTTIREVLINSPNDGRKIKTMEGYNRGIATGTINAPISTGYYGGDVDEEELSR